MIDSNPDNFVFHEEEIRGGGTLQYFPASIIEKTDSSGEIQNEL